MQPFCNNRFILGKITPLQELLSKNYNFKRVPFLKEEEIKSEREIKSFSLPNRELIDVEQIIATSPKQNKSNMSSWQKFCSWFNSSPAK